MDNYDALNRDITRAILHAKKRAKRHSGKFVSSPKLRKAELLTRYWNMRLNEVHKGYCQRVPLLAVKHD
jgi:hypothetical protein